MEYMIRKYPLKRLTRIIAIIAVVLVLLAPFALAIYSRLSSGSWPEWSGFGDYQPSSSGFQHAKTLWDWLDLIIAPLMLALVGIGINSTIRKNEKDREEKRTQNEKRNAEDRIMEDVLQSFLDKIDDLLTNPKLYNAEDGTVLRNIARTRTLTTLRRIDFRRKSILLHFLTESGLVNKQHGFVIIDLSGANLENVEIHDANFEGAILNEANLQGAKLDHCNLNGAFLIDTNLQSSYLMYCSLENAKLSADVPLARAQITNLRGANLNGASLANTNMIDVRFDENTVLPDGTSWMPNTDLLRFTEPMGFVSNSDG